MLYLSATTLAAVVDQAMTDEAAHPRWLNAINRAVAELVSNPYIARQDAHLLIASPSGEIYSANGVCQCEAFKRGQPCWHRAAARLVRLHDEAIERERPARELADRVVAIVAACEESPSQRYARQASIERQRAAQAALDECFA